MTILVTGGAGFIGSNFVLDWLRRSQEPVVNVDKLTYAGNLSNLAQAEGDPRHLFVHGDIGDGALMRRLLGQYAPRAVLNFAAESHVDRSIRGPADFIDTNVVGTFRLLESVRDYLERQPAAGAAFRFLHVSTDEVYGSLSDGDPPFREDHPHRPNSPYAASKAASDHLVRAWCHTYGLPVLTTNCSNNYGPFQFPEKLVPLCIHNALAGRPLPIYGDGRQVRDWLFVGDHVRAIAVVLERGRPGETYNIGGASERTNLETVRAVCRALDALHPRADGCAYEALIEFVRDRPGHDRRYAIDAGKMAQQFGWRPEESFESGIDRTVRWYLGNQAWVREVTSGAYRDWVNRHYGAR